MNLKQTRDIKIGERLIGKNYPVFIIAEAGVNHNGDIVLAKKLIDVAVESGADAVKFQTFDPKTLVTKDASQADYQAENIGNKETQYEMLDRLKLKREYHKELQQYAKEKNIIFCSTPFSDSDVDFLDELGIPFFKIGSSDTNNLPLLKYIAEKNKPMIVSTGMSDMEDILEAVSIIRKSGNEDIVILHCTTQYPTPTYEVNLHAMLTMKEKCDVLVGYSDHTKGIEVPIASVAMGACVIEKHFTLDKNMEGPDHKASLEPDELKEMVRMIRNIEKALGAKEKKPSEITMKVAEVAQKSIISNKDIKAGSVIKKEDLIIKRPGTGIEPKHLEDMIGKEALVDISKDSLIKWEYLK
jgi:N-acetylneuraminate synthase/N,N'-diacetyllegionaminate synthase